MEPVIKSTMVNYVRIPDEYRKVVHIMLYIGIDLGTSAVKLLLMEENGSISYWSILFFH